jgi:MFS family permease
MSLEHRRRLTLAATVLGSSLAFVDATVVVVALPTIQHDLHFSLAGEQWVFLAYSLALAALYLPPEPSATVAAAGRRSWPESSVSSSPPRWPAPLRRVPS